MFACIFGLSMDYEVLLLSRIQEAYRRTGDNTASVAEGLARTAGVITGAALIMVSVFAAFALADTITIKSIGVGHGDRRRSSTRPIIRVLLVPATMRLLGDWNWWAPGPLKRFADRLGLRPRRGRPGRDADRRAATRPRGGRLVSDEEPRVVHGEVEEPGSGSGSFRLEQRTWTWDDEDVRRGLPWMGVFLVAFGGILLVGTAFPDAHILGSAITTALGVALLVSWATGRGWGLYPGLLITAYSLPGLLIDLDLLPPGGGYGTFLFGLGLLGVALMRWTARHTWGWQLVVGGILALAGGSEVASRLWPGVPTLGELLGPLVLILIGLVIITRAIRH